MLDKLIRLSEEDDRFMVTGNARVFFRIPEGFVVMHHPIYGAIPEEAVDGLVIEKNEVYLNWRRGAKKEHTFLGEVENIEQAKAFALKVNLLYDKRSADL